jgi:ketosteroid isomerase-like protein
MTATEVGERLELQALITRYAHAVDGRDIAELVACFAVDARLSTNGGAATVEGRQAIEAYFTDAFTRPALGPGTRSSHLLTNSNIVVQGDRAEIETLGLAALAQPEGSTVRLRGLHYSDRCERVSGEWLIKSREHRALWQCDAPGGLI